MTDPSPPPPPKKRRKTKEKSQVKKAAVLNDESNEECLVIMAKPQSDVQKLKRRKRRKTQNSRTKQNQKKKEKQVKTDKKSEMSFQTSESKEFVKPTEKNSFVPSYVNQTSRQRLHCKRKKSCKVYGVPDSEPTDSGVDGGSSGSIGGNGNNSNANKDDVPQGGDGGNGSIGGGGNKNNGRDDDDDNNDRKPLWRNGSQITDSSEEEDMETDEDECSTDNAVAKEPIKAQPAMFGKGVPDIKDIDQNVARTKVNLK